MGLGFHPVPKSRSGLSRHQEAVAADLAREQHWRAVCRAVEERDGDVCRICGRRCVFTKAKTRAEKADPHHVIFQSANGPDETWNVAKLCRDCHDEVHVHRRLMVSGNADERTELGKLGGLRVERLTDAGWTVVGMR